MWRSGANSQPVLNVAYKGRVGAVHQGFLAKTNSKYVRAGSGDLAGLKQQAQERLKKKEDWKERFFVLHAGEDPWLVSRRPSPGTRRRGRSSSCARGSRSSAVGAVGR